MTASTDSPTAVSAVRVRSAFQDLLVNSFLRLRNSERWIVVISLVATVALTTPWLPGSWGAAIRWGLPTSLWWVIGWLLVVFSSLVAAHLKAPQSATQGDGSEGSRGPEA